MKGKYAYLVILFLTVASLTAFGRITGNDFINFDDTDYITENSYVQSGINLATIKWAFSTFHIANWQPLTLISHALDWSLFGANAGGHHFVNLLLHIGAVIFIFLFFSKTTASLWPAAFAAAFFALHPLRVESVAWASERKDVLSMFFGMACLYAYAFYSEKPGLSRYLLCLILFAMALMAKSMLVTLPFALMLLDYWPLKRWQKALTAPDFSPAGKLVLEKIPFISMAIIVAIVAFLAAQTMATVAKITDITPIERLANAVVSYVTYLEKTFWPVKLAIFYPYERPLPPDKIIISVFILMIVTSAVFYWVKKLPFLFVGWFWFLGTLIPVIGLVQVGEQAAADRYTYLPSVGLAVMLSWGIPLLFRKKDIRQKVLFPAALTILGVLAFLTWRQCGYWKDSIRLFSYTLSVTTNNHLAHANLGVAFSEQGQDEMALNHLEQAILINPYHCFTYLSRGSLYLGRGLYDQAIEDYSKALRLKPPVADGYYDHLWSKLFYNRGIAYYRLGQHGPAIGDFDKAISLNPYHSKAYNNRGSLYADLGENQLAINDFSQAISIDKNFAAAYANRAVVYFRQGDIISGCRDAKKACALKDCKILELINKQGYCR